MFWPLVAWTPHSSCLYPPAALVDLPLSSAASSLVGSHMPSQKQKSKSVKSPQVTHLPSTHHPPIHRTPSNHPTKHTAATPLFWDHTGLRRLRLQSRHQTQPGCSPWCRALNLMGFPCLDQGLQGVHLWHGSSWLPASSASLLWRLAWSGATATEPCRFPFGGSNSTAEGISSSNQTCHVYSILWSHCQKYAVPAQYKST